MCQTSNPPRPPTKVLRMPLHKLNLIMGIDLHCGPTVQIEDNYFTAYVMDVTNTETVQDMYMKIRLNHAEARHIVCAWNILGEKQHKLQDFCDDEDYGVGAKILKLMQASKMEQTVLYVVRVAGKEVKRKEDPILH